MTSSGKIAYFYDFHNVAKIEFGECRSYGEEDNKFVTRTITLFDENGDTLVITVYTQRSESPKLPVTTN